jgi:hypothetical protein
LHLINPKLGKSDILQSNLSLKNKSSNAGFVVEDITTSNYSYDGLNNTYTRRNGLPNHLGRNSSLLNSRNHLDYPHSSTRTSSSFRNSEQNSGARPVSVKKHDSPIEFLSTQKFGCKIYSMAKFENSLIVGFQDGGLSIFKYDSVEGLILDKSAR